MTRQSTLYHYITKTKSKFSINLPATKQLKCLAAQQLMNRDIFLGYTATPIHSIHKA